MGAKMDWMYDANKQGVNSEEYLLGKSVDSAILDAQAEKQRQAQQGTSGAIAVDMTNKIREDPLFAIKQREAAKRKALLENPIRLKQLQHMLQSEVGEKSSKKSKKKKEKKSKKSKKHKSSHHKSSSEDSDNSEDSDDLDAKLMEKLKSQALKGREDEVKAVLKGQQYGLIGGKPSTKSRSEKRSDGKETRRSHERQVERIKRDGDDEDTRRKKRDREEERKSRSGHSSYRNSGRSRSRSPVREERRKPSKMDEAELERRRKEMMDNAKWRDEQRKNRVEKYKHEAAKEDEMERKKSKKAEFFNPLKVTSNSSVEDRIKRNIHNIQRTKADLDKNFAKR